MKGPSAESGQYFDNAKQDFMKELVEFSSRGDFDKFMSRVENSYFDGVAQVTRSPYPDNNLPQYPPKPYQGVFNGRRSAAKKAQDKGARAPPSTLAGPARSMRDFDSFVDTVRSLNQQRSSSRQKSEAERRARAKQRKESAEREKLLANPMVKS